MNAASQELEADVLIVGAGPTGMVAALALSRLGVSCVLVDRLQAVAAHPKAHELSPRSLEILIGLGVPFEALNAEASPYDDSARVVFCATLPEELGRVDLREDHGDAKYFRAVRAPKPFLNLSQSALEEVLRAQLQRCPGVTTLLGHRWLQRTDAPGAAFVESLISPAAEGAAPLRVRSRYLLCADGAGSPCRRALGIAMKGPDRIQDFVNAYFEHDLSAHIGTRAKLYFTLDPGCPGTFVAHHVGKRWVYHMPVYPAVDRAEDLGEAALLRRIEHALGKPIPGLKIRSIETWRMTGQVAERFRAGRAFLLGDAAHRFPPTGGLGMNSGIADAHNLSWKLAAVLRGAADPALLDSYETERRPVIERNCQESLDNYQRMFDIFATIGLPRGGMATAARLRGGLSRWLPSFLVTWALSLAVAGARRKLRRARQDPARRAQVQAMIHAQRGHFDRLGLDLGASYTKGAVVPDGSTAVAARNDVTDYRPSTRPGARLPHVWLDEAQTRSSHDLIDPGCCSLLIGPNGAAWTRAAQQLAARPDALRVVTVDGGALFAIDDIGPDGALLVRPDGHVAWRALGAAPDATHALRAVMTALHLQGAQA